MSDETRWTRARVWFDLFPWKAFSLGLCGSRVLSAGKCGVLARSWEDLSDLNVGGAVVLSNLGFPRYRRVRDGVTIQRKANQG